MNYGDLFRVHKAEKRILKQLVDRSVSYSLLITRQPAQERAEAAKSVDVHGRFVTIDLESAVGGLDMRRRIAPGQGQLNCFETVRAYLAECLAAGVIAASSRPPSQQLFCSFFSKEFASLACAPRGISSMTANSSITIGDRFRSTSIGF